MRAGAPASVQVSQLARDLYRMGPAGRRRLKTAFERAGRGALSDAKSRASWSRRIPAAIKAQPMVGTGLANRVGVQLRVSVAAAPHARPYEGLGQGGSFRHPVFGRDRWVSQNTRPYIWPAVRGRIPQITADVDTAYEAAARECGFR